MKKEKIIVPANSYLMLFLVIILLIGGIIGISMTKNAVFAFSIIAALFILPGFLMVQPNNSRVLLRFGKYIGSVKKNGVYLINPF